MLTDLYPRVHQQYSRLPLFGSVLDEFADWLASGGYHRGLVYRHIWTTRDVDRRLRTRGCNSLSEINREHLDAICPKNSQDNIYLASTIRLWERYLEERSLLPKPQSTRGELLAMEYRQYLEAVRGLSLSTLNHHCLTVVVFLDHIGYEQDPCKIGQIDRQILEQFVQVRGGRVNRFSLQHEIAHLRSFLRFLGMQRQIRPGLDTQIDTPRVYRGEQLPRSLPWDTVCALLESIDRHTPMGRRDYAMLSLITTYGLRSCEIVGLKLDDIHWRLGQIQIPIRKTGATLTLPLTGAVADSLVQYLRRGRPSLPYREVFLRCRAPAGKLKPTAVTEIFQACVRRSGLDIRFQGPHCLRHSYAVNLLRQGTPLKVIGDLLGHRLAESTCVYLRLAVEDLRDVALDLPKTHHSQAGKGESK
jgi:site-specific recombinase XerD